VSSICNFTVVRGYAAYLSLRLDEEAKIQTSTSITVRPVHLQQTRSHQRLPPSRRAAQSPAPVTASAGHRRPPEQALQPRRDTEQQQDGEQDHQRHDPHVLPPLIIPSIIGRRPVRPTPGGAFCPREFRFPVAIAAPVGLPTSHFPCADRALNRRFPGVSPGRLEGWRTQ